MLNIFVTQMSIRAESEKPNPDKVDTSSFS